MEIKRKGGHARLERLKTGGWYLTTLYVDREYRGRGVASMLLRNIGKLNGPIYLLASGEFGADIRGLYRLYEKHGFCKCKDRHDLPYNYNMVRW